MTVRLPSIFCPETVRRAAVFSGGVVSLLTTGLWVFVPTGSAWQHMWLLALSIYAAAKFLSAHRAVCAGSSPTTVRLLQYLVLWPGMNAAEFLASNSAVPRPRIEEWTAAVFKTTLGAALIFIIAGRCVHDPLVCAWIAMAGFILLLHSGAFHLISLVLRRCGINAPPLMNSPLRARSLTEFWSNRWNRAFRDLTNPLIFRSVARRLGTTAATMTVFLVSGLIHDLVISVPAGAGYGLPTTYFAAQGFGILFERTATGRRLLRPRVCGVLFTASVAGVGAYWLFHDAFVVNVVLPMLHAIHAL